MDWKKRHRSFYYKYAEDPADILLKPEDALNIAISILEHSP